MEKVKMNELFRQNLKKLREAAGLSQETLAENIGSTRQTIGRYENGNRTPDIITAYYLAQTIGCKVEDFFKKDQQ